MTTNETNRIVRWLVIVVLGLATAGMAAVSLRANYLFGYGFGQTPDKAQVFGWANVAADLWKVSGLILITSLWRAHQKRLALILMPIWALCFVWGLAGAIGVYPRRCPHPVLIRHWSNATHDWKSRPWGGSSASNGRRMAERYFKCSTSIVASQQHSATGTQE